jgi:hypothetical protein
MGSCIKVSWQLGCNSNDYSKGWHLLAVAKKRKHWTGVPQPTMRGHQPPPRRIGVHICARRPLRHSTQPRCHPLLRTHAWRMTTTCFPQSPEAMAWTMLLLVSGTPSGVRIPRARACNRRPILIRQRCLDGASTRLSQTGEPILRARPGMTGMRMFGIFYLWMSIQH